MTQFRKTLRAAMSSGLAASLCSAWLAVGCGSASDTTSASSRGPADNGLESNDTKPDGSVDGDKREGEPDVSQGEADGSDAATHETQRVIGYLPTYRFEGHPPLHLDTLTHLVLAFALPSSNGEAELLLPPVDGKRAPVSPRLIRQIVEEAHAAQVKVLVALAGGDEGGRLTSERLAQGVESYVSSIVNLVSTYQLDGVDVDIEGEAIHPETFEPLMLGLAQALHVGPAPKLLTAAVGSYMRQNYRTLGAADFVSIMSYDRCGSWSSPCEHSTFAQAELDLADWSSLAQPDEHGQVRPLGAERVVLGVPFYAWCWGELCPLRARKDNGEYELYSGLSYGQVEQFCASGTFANCSPSTDLLRGADAEREYYVSFNSPSTIAKKAELAARYGGLMIWELGQDSGDGTLFAPIERTFARQVTRMGSVDPGSSPQD